MTKDEKMKRYLKVAEKAKARQEAAESKEKANNEVDKKVIDKGEVAIKKTIVKKGPGLLKAGLFKIATLCVQNVIENICGDGIINTIAETADTVADVNLAGRGAGALWNIKKEYDDIDSDDIYDSFEDEEDDYDYEPKIIKETLKFKKIGSYIDHILFLENVNSKNFFAVKSNLEGMIRLFKGERSKVDLAINYAIENNAFYWESDIGYSLKNNYSNAKEEYDDEKERLVQNFTKERYERVLKLYNKL